METGLFEIQVGHLRDYRQHRELLLSSRDVIHAVFRPPDSSNAAAISHSAVNKAETVPSSGKNADSPAVAFARCFLRLANLPNFALDRLSRYEATLWRQAGRTLYALEKLDRRKPQERARRVWLGTGE
jgi:hypothetical protein